MISSLAKRCQRPMTAWRWLLLCMVAIESLWLLAPPPQRWVEAWFSQGFYPCISGALVFLQDCLPFPVTLLLLGALTIALARWLYRQSSSVQVAGESHWRILPRFLWVALQSAIVFALWVLVAWGAGYQRPPVAERWWLNDAPLTPEESERLRPPLLEIVRENAGAAGSRNEAVASISKAMESMLAERGDASIRVPRQVRATPPGAFLLFGTAGMCVPGAFEPFADGAYDDITFIQVAAHELAHVAGYNRESEATLIGYMAGLAADDPLGQYAVALGIYMDLLVRIPEEKDRDAAWNALPERARKDYLRGREIAAQYRINVKFLQQMGYRVYDTYLKSQGIEEGMKNYSSGLRLFAGAWRSGFVALPAHRNGEELHDATAIPIQPDGYPGYVDTGGLPGTGGLGKL